MPRKAGGTKRVRHPSLYACDKGRGLESLSTRYYLGGTMKEIKLPDWAGVIILIFCLGCLFGTILWIMYLFFDLIRNL